MIQKENLTDLRFVSGMKKSKEVVTFYNVIDEKLSMEAFEFTSFL